MASRISLAFALLAGAASAFATLLTFSVALAITQQFGTAEEARAMLDRAAAALKSDEASPPEMSQIAALARANSRIVSPPGLAPEWD
jgi:hypothetical protein